MSITSQRINDKVEAMMHQEFFGDLLRRSKYAIGTTVAESTDENNQMIISIDDMGVQQSYALTRFLNSEYARFCGKKFDYSIGDPTIKGIAQVVDKEDESIIITISQEDLDKFDDFLSRRGDDLLFVLDNSRISKYLRERPWEQARAAIEADRQV